MLRDDCVAPEGRRPFSIFFAAVDCGRRRPAGRDACRAANALRVEHELLLLDPQLRGRVPARDVFEVARVLARSSYTALPSVFHRRENRPKRTRRRRGARDAVRLSTPARATARPTPSPPRAWLRGARGRAARRCGRSAAVRAAQTPFLRLSSVSLWRSDGTRRTGSLRATGGALLAAGSPCSSSGSNPATKQ